MIDGVIYKLFSKNPLASGFYIGSTKDLHNRQLNHKSCCNREKGKQYNFSVYKYIRDNGGFDEFDFEILELGEYQDKYCMRDRERYFIETLKPTLNSEIPNRTSKEHYQDNKEKKKKQRKEHYQDNKEYSKEYYKKNEEKISKRRREKIECKVCNCMIMRTNKSGHNRTQKHIRNLNNTG